MHFIILFLYFRKRKRNATSRHFFRLILLFVVFSLKTVPFFFVLVNNTTRASLFSSLSFSYVIQMANPELIASLNDEDEDEEEQGEHKYAVEWGIYYCLSILFVTHYYIFITILFN